MDEDRPELELRHYLGVLRRRLPVVLLITALVVGGALALDFRATRIYAATTDVLLTPDQSQSIFSNSTNNGVDPVRQVDTQIQLLQSRSISQPVNQRLGRAASRVTDVTVSDVGQTDILQVKVESPDPALAQRAADLYADTYVATRRGQAVDELIAAGRVLQTRLNDMQGQLNALDARLAVGGDAALRTQREALTAQYQLFQSKLNELQVDSSLKTAGAQVVARATKPTTPSKPRPIRDSLAALAVGLVLGLGLAFLAEYLDDKIHRADDVARYGHGLTVLAEIPAVQRWKDRKAPFVVALDDPGSPPAEAYRSLRTSIQLIGLRRPLQTVLVTSPMSSEGKTTTVANLGVTIARTGRRVVIVDLDMRRARLSQFFGAADDIGFTSVLVGDVPMSAALNSIQVARGVPPLVLLASGPLPPNPSELVGAARVNEVLASLQSIADLVIIDSAPLLPVTDALVLAGRVDGVVLVVGADRTRRRHLSRAVELLQQAEVPILGGVLNATRARYRRYGYGDRYHYGYQDVPEASPGRLKVEVDV